MAPRDRLERGRYRLQTNRGRQLREHNQGVCSAGSERSGLSPGRVAREEHLGGVDLPLGGRPLRVAHLELHVRLRVARRRLVREPRVAEVVPSPNGLVSADRM